MSIDRANEKLGPAVLRHLKNGSFPVSQSPVVKVISFKKKVINTTITLFNVCL